MQGCKSCIERSPNIFYVKAVDPQRWIYDSNSTAMKEDDDKLKLLKSFKDETTRKELRTYSVNQCDIGRGLTQHRRTIDKELYKKIREYAGIQKESPEQIYKMKYMGSSQPIVVTGSSSLVDYMPAVKDTGKQMIGAATSTARGALRSFLGQS